MQNKTRAIGLLRMVMAADLTLWSKVHCSVLSNAPENIMDNQKQIMY